jgi:hypothetical protein
MKERTRRPPVVDRNEEGAASPENRRQMPSAPAANRPSNRIPSEVRSSNPGQCNGYVQSNARPDRRQHSDAPRNQVRDSQTSQVA